MKIHNYIIRSILIATAIALLISIFAIELIILPFLIVLSVLVASLLYVWVIIENKKPYIFGEKLTF